MGGFATSVIYWACRGLGSVTISWFAVGLARLHFFFFFIDFSSIFFGLSFFFLLESRTDNYYFFFNLRTFLIL